MKVSFLLPPDILADPLEVDIPVIPRIGEIVRISTLPLHADSMDDYAFRVTNVVHDLIAGELDTGVELTPLREHDDWRLEEFEARNAAKNQLTELASGRLPDFSEIP